MRIAIAAEGTRGDIYPMLGLAEGLIARGHSVRFCAPPDFAEVVASRGAEFVAVGESVRHFMSESATALHRGGLPLVRRILSWGERSLIHQFRILPEAIRGMDRILAGGTIVAAASAAELHGIPFRFVAYTPALLPSAHHSPLFFPVQTGNRLVNRVLWWSARALLSVALRRDLNRARGELGLSPVRDVARHLLSPHPVLAVDHPIARMPADCPLAVEQIPCLHPRDGDPLPEKLERFLDTGPAPVFFGFGSMTDPDPAATTGMLLATIDALGCRALISRGWAGLGEVALPERVMAVGAVSHTRLFARVAAVVHHGGAGTTHTAARAGVPQIVIPHLLDQYYFARRVHELGVGPPAIPRKRFGVERLVEALRAILDNEHVAGRARELGQRLAAVEPLAARLDALLDAASRPEPGPAA